LMITILALPACATTAPPPPASPPPPLSDGATVAMLVERSREGNDALLRGDGTRYGALIPMASDFTLMSPFGGTPKPAGAPSPERLVEIGRFFKNGTLRRQELVHVYTSPDMITLATIEHAHAVEVGGLPAQDWMLRVTLVYRRVGSEWQLIHRHADPLAHGISYEQAAILGRGDSFAATAATTTTATTTTNSAK
jgi:ketosteroid isomerase-like protein